MRRVKGSDENKIRSWGSRGEFLVSCIGYTVGIGNIVQFPFLVFRNGGAAFLVPYLLFLVVVGMPMYFMEAAIGQFAQGGVVSAFYAMLPASTGVGVAMVVLSLIVCIYYNILLSYCLFYLFQSFRSILPWSVCDETWGADQRCFTTSGNQTYHKILLLEGQCLLDDIEGCSQSSLQSSAQQFWNKVLLKQDKIGLEKFGDIGSIDLNLAFCLLLTWISVTVIVVNGVKISRKISYSTALFPYILLFILLVRGLTLEGSTQGLRILFNPKWSKLEELSVWRDAALQVFYSLGLSWGGLTMLGSFNKFNDRIHIDTQIVPIIDFFTSIVASIVVFSLLGHREHSTGVSIQETVTGEQALAFISIPEALEQIPTPNLWSIIFFLMLFILGLNCQYVLFEVILTTLKDLFPMLWSHQEILTCLLSTSCFLLGLPCISEKGQRVLEIMDLYGTKITVIIVGLVELLMVMWLYGVQRFCRDIKCMVGVSPGFYFQICWSLFCPLVLVILIIFCLIPWSPTAIIYSLRPDWALKIGWSLFGLSLIQIPGWFIAIFIYKICQGEGWTSVLKTTNGWIERRNCTPVKCGFQSTLKLKNTAGQNNTSFYNIMNKMEPSTTENTFMINNEFEGERHGSYVTYPSCDSPACPDSPGSFNEDLLESQGPPPYSSSPVFPRFQSADYASINRQSLTRTSSASIPVYCPQPPPYFLKVTSPHDDDDDENDENDENDDTGGKMVPRLDTGSNTEAELLREELKEALRSRKHTK